MRRQEEALPFETCAQNVQLKWSTEVSSSVRWMLLPTSAAVQPRCKPHRLAMCPRVRAPLSLQVYATPVITDLYSDGRKDVIVPSFVHYLEVSSGHRDRDTASKWQRSASQAAYSSSAARSCVCRGYARHRGCVCLRVWRYRSLRQTMARVRWVGPPFTAPLHTRLPSCMTWT